MVLGIELVRSASTSKTSRIEVKLVGVIMMFPVSGCLTDVSRILRISRERVQLSKDRMLISFVSDLNRC